MATLTESIDVGCPVHAAQDDLLTYVFRRGRQRAAPAERRALARSAAND